MEQEIKNDAWIIRQDYMACDSFQWARELLVNAIEAGATKVEFGLLWEGVEKYGKYWRTVSDNGSGMDADELKRFFLALYEGGKRKGGVHDNFGVGAKITTQPWNEEGVVIISRKQGKSSMIRIHLDTNTNKFHLFEWDADDLSVVIDPEDIDWEAGVDWGNLRPVGGGDGTLVVLCGNKEAPDTFGGDTFKNENAFQGLTRYLNERFWDTGDVDIKVYEAQTRKGKHEWPAHPADRFDPTDKNALGSPKGRYREIKGARPFFTGYREQTGRRVGKHKDSGVVSLCEGRVKAHWTLWEGDRPDIDQWGPEKGFFAVMHRSNHPLAKEELYGLSRHFSQWQWFGINYSSVQKNLVVVFEPQHYTFGKLGWGVHPNKTRSGLLFTADGNTGPCPIFDWADEFRQKLPEPIRESILAARSEAPKGNLGDAYRKRLAEKFSNRWWFHELVSSPGSHGRPEHPGTLTGNPASHDTRDKPPSERKPSEHPPSPFKGRKKSTQQEMTPGGSESGVTQRKVEGVPRWRLVNSEEWLNMGQSPDHIAAWFRHDVEGPLVVINTQSPVIEEHLRYQMTGREVAAEEILPVITESFGEIAAARVAHAEHLRRKIKMSPQEFDDKYLSPESLTISLMGLVAEEAVLSPRMGQFGRKRD